MLPQWIYATCLLMQANGTQVENNMASKTEQPSLALLQFIGHWETSEGESINPMDLMTPVAEQLENVEPNDEKDKDEIQDYTDTDIEPD